MSLIADETQKGTGVQETASELLDGSLTKSVWTELPDNLLLHIFCFLSPKEVLLAGEVCRNWHRLSKDEMLWKFLLQETLNICRNKIKLPNSSSSWFAEFQRIHIETPIMESQVLEKHTDEVLHVAFSHDGQLLASSSKDCSVILWRVVGNSVSLAQEIKFKEYNWEYVQFCEFNASDTLLLVSGVNKLRQFSFRGEIFICELQGSSVVGLVHGINNEPYDVFGAWLTEKCYISGTFEFLETENNGSSVSELWANCVDELPENQTNLARIVNRNASSVRTVLVARPSGGVKCTYAAATWQQDDHICLIFTHGTVTYVPHQIVFKWLRRKKCSNSNCQVVRKSSFNNGPEQGTEMLAGGYKSSEKPDHCIETNAHIIGMSLSPDHEHLYVNCRQWEQRDGESEFPPEISKDITLQVYSLSTYELVGVHAGHRAYTPNDGCFFIFLNVADNLVASGAEDHCVHVWDRHFEAKLATLKGHSNVVNCVAFNPANQEMLVSASDDHTIRVWRSRQLSKSNHKSKIEKQCEEVSFVDEGMYRETTV